MAFRILLFKVFYRIETWQPVNVELGQVPAWKNFDLATYDVILTGAFNRGQRLYSAAYVMAPPSLSATVGLTFRDR